MSIESEWPVTANPKLPPDHPYWGSSLNAPNANLFINPAHNQYCIDDWDFYHGDGPRGMGPNGDGCVCGMDPNPGSVSHIKDGPEIVRGKKMTLTPIGELGPVSVAQEFPLADVSQETIDLLTGDRGNMPRLWDKAPIAVTHIAGACIVLFNRYMRQRCEWCGVVLLEYDLQRIAVPAGQDPMPANWPPGKLVRVDGHISAAIDEPDVVDGDIQLPPDACTFDPKTQIK